MFVLVLSKVTFSLFLRWLTVYLNGRQTIVEFPPNNIFWDHMGEITIATT